MKRKKILKEGVQIPYRLDDFKPGDRIHIIGDYDDVSFDNFATVIGTTNDIDSPYSDDAAILVHLDSPNQISGALHDSDTGIPEIKKKCRHNCWWLWMYQFNPEYNYENYRVNYDENRVIKLNHNMPDAYDVISSLYESEDFDWAMDMAKNIDDSQIKLLEIPKKRNGYYNIILLDKPGITYQTIANIVDYINEKTSWKSTLSSKDIEDIHNNYTRKGFSYINLRPNNHVSYGSSEDSFAYLYDMDFSDPSVKIIRPY